jgi:histone acetyltransferase (RNA polymerase elongator complex component)
MVKVKADPHSVFIVPVFLPHYGCPHRCVYCNQVVISGEKQPLPPKHLIHRHIETFLGYRKSRYRTEIAFYGGNFLGLPFKKTGQLLETAAEWIDKGEVDGIRFSTRPDTVNEQILDRLSNFPVTTVEIGAQSMDDRVLALNRRGHSSMDVVNSVRDLKKMGMNIGIQMMVGLPGDSDEGALESGRRICRMFPDFVRIYPTVVISGSTLADWHSGNRYKPLDLKQAVGITARLYTMFRRRAIRVIRMGLQASDQLADTDTLVAGPYHPAFGHLVLSEIVFDRIVSRLESHPPASTSICIRVHPKNLSRVYGLKKQNVQRLSRRFQLKKVLVTGDNSLEEEDIIVSDLAPPQQENGHIGFLYKDPDKINIPSTAAGDRDPTGS